MSRPAYHHGHLRSALVEEAVRVARTDGPGGLSLRDLARRVGVSHNAAYRHFADREDLVAAVAEHAMVGLRDAMQRQLDAVDAVEPVPRARLRLAGIGRAYVEYALAEPGLFQVAFSFRAGSGPSPLLAEAPYLMLGHALDDLLAVGFLSPEARPGAEHLCWSCVHGFAVLVTAGHVRAADVEADLERLLVAIDRSLGSSGVPSDGMFA